MRNPLHYAAMSRYTCCFKTLKALLHVDIDNEPEYPFFEHLYFEIAALDRADHTTPIDPRKTANLISEFCHLLDPKDFKRISKGFNKEMSAIIKQALDQQDQNSHTPLHIASYVGDFKSARLFVDLGADQSSDDFKTKPLMVSKDKFARSIITNLNDAATGGKFDDVKYLVNCGELIDHR
jgi:hypothetical protein